MNFHITSLKRHPKLEGVGFLLAILFVLSVFYLGVKTTSLGAGQSPRQLIKTLGPRTAATMSQNETYPAYGGQLWENSTYNLTAGLRDDTLYNRAYSGGYLAINKSGSLYSNVSLIPPGTFNATDSFTSDTV